MRSSVVSLVKVGRMVLSDGFIHISVGDHSRVMTIREMEDLISEGSRVPVIVDGNEYVALARQVRGMIENPAKKAAVFDLERGETMGRM